MSRNLTILMLGGAKRVSMAEALIAAGNARDIAVDIYSHELSSTEPIACVGKIITGGRYDSEGIMNEMRGIIKSYRVDVILPFIDPAISVAARCAAQFGVFSPTTPEATAAVLFDKVEGAKLFESHDIPVPKTFHTLEDVRYPAILKPRCGSASRGIIIAHNAAEIPAGINTNAYLMQEYIANREEYTLDCYIGTSDSEIKCIVPRLRIATAGGEVTKTRTCRIPALISLGERTIRELGLRGAVTLQFLLDKNSGRFLLMEINPRLGGGVICSLGAGADIAGMIVDEALGAPASPAKLWRDGALMTRYMKEVMFYND